MSTERERIADIVYRAATGYGRRGDLSAREHCLNAADRILAVLGREGADAAPREDALAVLRERMDGLQAEYEHQTDRYAEDAREWSVAREAAWLSVDEMKALADQLAEDGHEYMAAELNDAAARLARAITESPEAPREHTLTNETGGAS